MNKRNLFGIMDNMQQSKWVQILIALLYTLLGKVSGRVFTNGPGDPGSISGQVIPKTQKMVLDTSLLNTQHYKVHFKGKVEQSREGVAPLQHYLDVVAIERGAFGYRLTTVANFTFFYLSL